MNKQEIELNIELLKGNVDGFKALLAEQPHHPMGGSIEHQIDALEMAISALEQQLTNGWIPVSSGRLPEDTDGDDLATVYVCMKFKDSPFGNDDAVYQDVVDFMTDRKIWLVEDCFNVIAWRPRFEPYKEVSE